MKRTTRSNADPRPPELPEYILGLDLGQSADFSALAVLERAWKPVEADQDETHYALRHLYRWPLKTPYPQIIADVAELVARPPLNKPILAIDKTGVGAAVVDQFRQAKIRARLTPVLITAGHAVHFCEGEWHVPKKELVSAVQVILQARRIQFAPLPQRELLVKELLAFRVKVSTAGNESFEAWRERDHDDLVLAVAMAVWIGEGRRKHLQVW